MISGSAPSGRLGWLGWCIPVAAAVAVHVSTLRAGLILDDAALARGSTEGASLSPRSLFLESYISPHRKDPGYRPLTYLTFEVERLADASAATRHAVNVALHACAALLAFLLLRELLGGASAAPLAAACASIFALVPLSTDAVARIVGRADILAAIATFAAWWIAVRNAPGPERARESTGGILAAGAVTLVASFTRENSALAIPCLIVASCWLTGRRIPWRTAIACAGAVLGEEAIAGVILEGRPIIVTQVSNPLLGESHLTRALNGLALLWRYALEAVAPVGLSASSTRFDIPGRTSSDAVLWLSAIAAVAAIVGAVLALRRRSPLGALSVLVFALALVPVANIAFLAPGIFHERTAYTAVIALPIALGALVQGAGRWKKAAWLTVGAVLTLCTLMTVIRNEAWVQGDLERLTRSIGSADRARAIFREYSSLQESARSVQEKVELRDLALAEADAREKRDPSDGWALAIRGHVSSQEAKHAETVDKLTRAEALLSAASPPELDPLVYKLRGDAYLVLGKATEAFRDLDRYIRTLESEKLRADGITYSHRGMARGKQGDLQGALADLNAAIDARSDMADIWNNRGFCRFKLGDLAGAISDYQEGLKLCEREGVEFSTTRDSVHSFLLRIADIYKIVAEQHRTAGNAEDAEKAAEESARLKANADEIAARQNAPKK